MNEIRTAVDLHHPAGRAWRALTDRRLLPQWFAATDLDAEVGAQFEFEPADLPGIPGPIAGEVVELDEPHRIVMRWYEEDRQSLVIYDLRPSQDGCQLVLREYCEEGDWEPTLRDQRLQTYEQLLTGRLPAVLDWLAFREVDFPDDPDGDADLGADLAAGQQRARRRRLITGVAVGLIVVGAVAAGSTWLTRGGKSHSDPAAAASSDIVAPTGSAKATTPGPTRVAQSVVPTATPTPTPSPKRTKSAGAGAPPAANVSGTYSTVENRLTGYTGAIVIANNGNAPASGWTTTITLPTGAQVHDVSGASAQPQGRTVTFTGSPIPAGGSNRIQFEVSGQTSLGEKHPESCAVNGRSCAGL